MRIFLAIGVMLLLGCSEEAGWPNRDVPLALLNQEKSIAAGHELFLKLCRECHGTLSEGRNPRAARFVPPAPDFHEQRYGNSDPEYLYWRIEEGKRTEPFRSRGSVMPAWKPHLTEREIWQLVAYLRQRSNSHD